MLPVGALAALVVHRERWDVPAGEDGPADAAPSARPRRRLIRIRH